MNHKDIVLSFLIPVFLFSARIANGQKMGMHPMAMDDSKNVYLKMMDTMMINIEHLLNYFEVNKPI